MTGAVMTKKQLKSSVGGEFLEREQDDKSSADMPITTTVLESNLVLRILLSLSDERLQERHP
jgi:hypothetical protein